MRAAILAGVILEAALLTGCQGTKEQKAPPFLAMPKDMEVDIYEKPPAGQPPAKKPAPLPDPLRGEG
jgi:hypothetical protein